MMPGLAPPARRRLAVQYRYPVSNGKRSRSRTAQALHGESNRLRLVQVTAGYRKSAGASERRGVGADAAHVATPRPAGVDSDSSSVPHCAGPNRGTPAAAATPGSCCIPRFRRRRKSAGHRRVPPPPPQLSRSAERSVAASLRAAATAAPAGAARACRRCVPRRRSSAAGRDGSVSTTPRRVSGPACLAPAGPSHAQQTPARPRPGSAHVRSTDRPAGARPARRPRKDGQAA